MSGKTDSGFAAPDAVLDASGHDCPMPATLTRRRLDCMAPGQLLEVIATDPLAAVDLQILCDRCGHEWLGSREEAESLTMWIRVNPGRQPAAD